MKRSDMVKYLYKVLKTYEDCKIEKKDADKILKKLEKKGMLPPDININLEPPCECLYEWE